MKAGIVGFGNIGQEIYRTLTQKNNCGVGPILKSSGVYRDATGPKVDELENYPAYFEGVDIVFLAIPTFDNGETARNYIEAFMKEDTPVVTCEKGSLSNHYTELKKYLDNIGHSATVGGGTLMLKYLKERMKNPEVEEVHVILNGTLNFIFDEVSRGRSLGAVVGEAKKTRLCRAGSGNAD